MQDRVHDFAWFADKHFNVLQDTVRLPSGRAVQTMMLFTNSQPMRLIQGLEEVNTALRSYSRWVGEFPHSAVTTVDEALKGRQRHGVPDGDRDPTRGHHAAAGQPGPDLGTTKTATAPVASIRSNTARTTKTPSTTGALTWS